MGVSGVSVKIKSKSELKKIAVFEGQLLHQRRIKKNQRIIDLANKIKCTSAAIIAIERGRNPNGETKAKLIMELFGSADNFKKRVSSARRNIRDNYPTPVEALEKFEVQKSDLTKSNRTLNDMMLRKTIRGFFFKDLESSYSDDESFIREKQYEKFILDIEYCLNQFDRWVKLNIKIIKSDEYHTEFNRIRNLKIQLGDFAKAHKRQAKPSDFQLRLMNIFTLKQLVDVKRTYGYAKGKKGNYFVREFICQLYYLFKPYRSTEQEAIEDVYTLLLSLLAENVDAIFVKNDKTISEIIKKHSLSKKKSNEPIHFIKYIKDEAIRHSPVKSNRCRYSLQEFINLNVKITKIKSQHPKRR